MPPVQDVVGRLARRVPAWLVAVLFVVVYAAAVAGGRATRLEGTQLSLVWPAAAVAYVWLHWSWSRGQQHVDVALLTVATAALTFATGASAVLATALAAAATVQAVVAVRVVRRWSPNGWRLRTLDDLTVFVTASLLGATASVLVGPVALWLVLDAPIWATGGAWVLRNSAGAIVFAALALRLCDRRPRAQDPSSSRLEVAATGTVLCGFYWCVFGLVEPLPLAFVVLPLSIWVGLRNSTTVASANVLFTGAFVIAATAAGRGPFSGHAPSTRVFLAQGFVATVGLVTLSLALQRDEKARLVAEMDDSVRDLRACFDAGVAGMAALDVDGRVVQVNPAVRRLRLVPAERLQGMPLVDLVVEADRAAARALLSAAEATPAQVRLSRPDGTELWCEITATALRSGSADGRRTLVQVLDVDERHRQELRLADAACRDALTGLANRTVLERRLAELRDQPVSERLVLAYLDLDGFKQVNDRHGHEAGDAVLRATADRLRGLVRSGDEVVRLGGDEFVLLCPVGSDDEALRLESDLPSRTERLLEAPVDHGDKRLHVGASVGVVVACGGSDPDRTLAGADRAMYDRKRRRKQVAARVAAYTGSAISSTTTDSPSVST